MRTLLTKAIATTAVAIGTVVTFSWGTLVPGKTAQAARAASNGPVLVELFTSQGCSSCPPAEALLKELTQTPGVVAIEWHVDYWDTLVHRGSSWKDPFSNAAYTARQRAYNRALRGTSGVYTPQAVIGGQYETVVSRGENKGRDLSGANVVLEAVTLGEVKMARTKAMNCRR